MALSGKMIDFRRTRVGEDAAQRRPVAEIGVVEKETFPVERLVLPQVIDARTQQVARPAHDTMHGVAFREE